MASDVHDGHDDPVERVQWPIGKKPLPLLQKSRDRKKTVTQSLGKLGQCIIVATLPHSRCFFN